MKGCFRYETEIDLNNENSSQTQLILLTGKNKRVLEAGPATGYVTRVLKERGCSVTGIEIDEQAAAVAEPFCTRMIVGDIEKIDLSATFGEERFDVVIYGDVLEHLVKPDRVLENTRQILAPGGYVVASIPNVAHASLRLALLRGDFSYTDLGLLDRTHLHFYTRETVEELFRTAGYAISDWKRIVLEPFGTGQDLREEDYPPFLTDAMREDEDALTYQYVVKASVSKEPVSTRSRHEDGHRGSRTAMSASLKSLWAEHERTVAAERQAAHLRSELGETLKQVEETEQRLIEAEQHAGNLGHELNLIRGSIGYRMLEKARVPIRILAPSGSRERLPLVAAQRAIRLARRRGPMALVKKAVRVSEWPAVLRSFKRAAPAAMDLNAQYQIWLSKHSITSARAERLRREAEVLTYRPLVSIVTPVYNPEVSWLRDAIESVRRQVYGNWELCLADDGSTKPGVRELLEGYSRLDSRIKVTLGEQNGGISVASNAALALSTGEFVGLLDHDDVLTPDAVFEVVKLLNERPELDYVFSDEDKMELDGTRLDPFFKPDWAPDLLNCLNYVTHFSVYRKSIIDEVGGFRIGFEGSQDWDLTLRVTERTQRIAHIPRPLYSWRKVPGSAATSDRAKEYASAAAKKALGEAIDRRGLKAVVLDGPYRGYYRVKYEISGAPKVTIVIPTRDQAQMLRRCVDSIRSRSTYANYEIMIINNQSREAETLRYLETFGGRVIDYPHQFNYSAQMNLGVQAAGTDYVILLNNDTQVISPDWIEAMLEYGQRPDVGAVGARLFFPGGQEQHEGVLVGCGGGLAGHLAHGGYFGLGECVRNVSAVTAACMLVKTNAYEEVGGLDEDLRVAYNDVDFCLKLREKGYEVIYTPYAQLAHHEGGTRGHRHPEKDERLFRTRWADYRDPYYNPNFDVDHPFSLKL
ncbi:MAG: glycosyltransferase [Chloroflexi bacterium]|nr:glycosyltransferase [Chloroflexota bacterium]